MPCNEAVCAIREGTDVSELPLVPRLDVVQVDLRDTGRLAANMAGCDAVLHVAHQLLSPNIIAAAQCAGVRRVHFVTTTGVFSSYPGLTKQYLDVERQIRDSGLDWTILRPSMIYGTDRDLNMHKLLKLLSKSPVYPIFGSGLGLMQPVHVQDLAAGLFASVMLGDKTVRKEYNLVGRYPLNYREIVREAAKALGRKIKLVSLPYSVSLRAAQAVERVFSRSVLVSAEQIERLAEDKCFSWNAAFHDLGYDPRPFHQGIRQEVEILRSKGLIG
jgi:uncharacterized protein YbjT (DUF2867 family)